MLGKTYTKAECKALLNKDLATVARQINPYIKVDIPETTRGALYSFVYNVGAGNFRTSTLLRKINQSDIKGACDQLRRWTYAGGKQWKGLMTRREIEREICLWGQTLDGRELFAIDTERFSRRVNGVDMLSGLAAKVRL